MYGITFCSIFEPSETHFGQLLGPKINLNRFTNCKNGATGINPFWLLRPSSLGGAFSVPTWCHLGPTCVDMSKLGDVIVVNGGHLAKTTSFCMILGPDLMPTSDDMPKFVDVIIVNRGHLA